jgi:hypothetical protein
MHEGMGVFTPEKKHRQALHQSEAKIGKFKIFLKLRYLPEDVPEKNTVLCRLALEKVDIVRHTHLFMGLVKPFLVVYWPVVIKRYYLFPRHLFYIIQAPFGICRPILNGLFDNYRTLGLKIVIQELLFGYPGYSRDFLQIHGLNRFNFQN